MNLSSTRTKGKIFWVVCVSRNSPFGSFRRDLSLLICSSRSRYAGLSKIFAANVNMLWDRFLRTTKQYDMGEDDIDGIAHTVLKHCKLHYFKFRVQDGVPGRLFQLSKSEGLTQKTHPHRGQELESSRQRGQRQPRQAWSSVLSHPHLPTSFLSSLRGTRKPGVGSQR